MKQLASSTALLLLFSFMVVNSALVVLKLRPGEPHGQFEVPIAIPVLGVLVNATLITSRLASGEGGTRAPMIAGAIVVVVTILYFVLRPTNITDESLAAKSPSIRTGMRRSGLRRSNSALPKKGVIGSTS